MLLVVWCIGGQNLLQEVKHNLPKGDLQSNCCIGSAAMRMPRLLVPPTVAGEALPLGFLGS